MNHGRTRSTLTPLLLPDLRDEIEWMKEWTGALLQRQRRGRGDGEGDDGGGGHRARCVCLLPPPTPPAWLTKARARRAIDCSARG